MSEEYLPHIFEEFSREHTSTENKVVGTGLGLPIVKSLIELMGGNIKAESSQEVGTKFTVCLLYTSICLLLLILLAQCIVVMFGQI